MSSLHGAPSFVVFTTASSDQSVQNFSPTYQQLGNAFAYTNNVIIARVDGSDAGESTAIEYGVTSFPSEYPRSLRRWRGMRLTVASHSLYILQSACDGRLHGLHGKQ